MTVRRRLAAAIGAAALAVVVAGCGTSVDIKASKTGPKSTTSGGSAASGGVAGATSGTVGGATGGSTTAPQAACSTFHQAWTAFVNVVNSSSASQTQVSGAVDTLMQQITNVSKQAGSDFKFSDDLLSLSTDAMTFGSDMESGQSTSNDVTKINNDKNNIDSDCGASGGSTGGGTSSGT